MKKDNESEDVIKSTISDMASSLFVVLCDCYPELATTELEDIFNETFKNDVMIFINNYRQSVTNGAEFKPIGKDIAQKYTQQRFFEKLAFAIERSNRIRLGRSERKIMTVNQNKR
ncbi:TPA: hypothetical protein ACXRWW_004780 [Klebsiella variicola subsp. variicola]